MKKNGLKMAVGALLALLLVAGGAGCSSDGGNEENEIAVTSVKINSTAFSLAYNGTRTLIVTIEPSNATNKTVSWTSSDASVATVNSEGTVTALSKDGSATITATVGGKSDTVSVTVSETVAFASSEKTYSVADLGLTGTHVSSDNDDVATVAVESGVVTITSVAEGEVTITVMNDSSHTATIVLEIHSDGSIAQKSLEKYTPGNTVTPGGTTATGTIEKPTAADVSNASVEIIESFGWFNSAYIIFKQIDGATYKVLIDDKELDEPLIRYYDEYVYYEPTEDANLQVTWTKKTYSKVVRADALGLAAGEHTMKVAAVGTENTSEYSTVTMKVVDYDRSGFAFVNGKEPGAYKKDGTLKSGAVVIYLTNENKATVKATLGGTEYTGIPAITQAIKSKKITTPVDIRVIGTVVATASGKELSCADLTSAWALGVKEAANVTIEGVGHDATLHGAGLAAFKSENIEFSNLGLMKWGGKKDGDGVSLKETGYAWVHNLDVFYGDAGSDGDQVKGDGSMDMKDNSNHVVVAYNHFWDSGKMSLCGMKSESGPNYITYHHNWFDHSDSRHPRIRTMTVHVYNNYFDGNAKYGVGVTTGASCFVEGNFFRNANDPMMSSKQGTDGRGSGTFSGEQGGVIKSWNNFYTGNSNWASEGGSKSTSGRKLQFITNKYDYTNGTELGEYKEWYETVGIDNGDGTWTIYDSKVTNTDDTIGTNSLIAIEDATKKGAYYQISKGKTGFYIDVPANTTKVIVKAKCGSSGKSGTADMLSVNGTKVKMDMAADYTEYTVPVSVSADSTIEIANAHSGNSMNINEIKVIAATGWETKLTSGVDMTNIDAYEVDARSDQVPATVTTRSGGHTYSNFDVELGDIGMGITIVPTSPADAKKNVLAYAGRYHSDYAWNFTNATDDADYAKIDALNTQLVNYKTSMKAIQGTKTTASSSGNSGDSGTTTPATVFANSVTCIFDKNGSATTGVTCASGGNSKGTYTVSNSEKYTGYAKLNSGVSITFTTSVKMNVEILAKVSNVDTTKTKIKIGDTTYDLTGGSAAATKTGTEATEQYSCTATIDAGSWTIVRGADKEIYVFAIKLTPAE